MVSSKDVLRITDLGYCTVPLIGKRPFQTGWYGRGSRDRALIQQTHSEGLYNVGILCGTANNWLCVVDVDENSSARRFYLNFLPFISTICKTRRGAHFYFRLRPGCNIRNAVDRKNKRDIRYTGAQIVAPPSQVNGHSYRWVTGYELRPVEQLRELPVELLPPPRSGALSLDSQGAEDRFRLISRARRYLAKVDPAVSGQGGHNTTLRAACVLIQRFGLTIQESWPLMLEYNGRCLPPWGEGELLRKLTEAERLKQR